MNKKDKEMQQYRNDGMAFALKIAKEKGGRSSGERGQIPEGNIPSFCNTGEGCEEV